MRIVIILLTVTSLILSVIMAPWKYSLVITAVTCLLLVYWAWWDSRAQKAAPTVLEPKIPSMEEKKTSPSDLIRADFKVVFENILMKLNEAMAAAPDDWKYQYIKLGSDTFTAMAPHAHGWINSHAILQKFDNGVILFRFYLDYGHTAFNPNSYLMLITPKGCGYVSPYTFLTAAEEEIRKEVEKIIVGVIGDRQKITFPESLATRSMVFSPLNSCIFGVNFAYSPISDNTITTDRKMYYDEQTVIHQQYKDNLRLIVQDMILVCFATVVFDIKTKEASSQVMTSDKYQQITLSYSGALPGLFSWGFNCTLSKNEITIHDASLVGGDVETLFTDDEARTLIVYTAKKLLRQALQSIYPDLEFGSLKDKVGYSITYIE